MRRAARTDANHAYIRDGLRALKGVSVFDSAKMGGGFPDLVVGRRGRTYLIEIKNGSLPPSERRLSNEELEFHSKWKGHAVVVLTLEQAVEAIMRGELSE